MYLCFFINKIFVRCIVIFYLISIFCFFFNIKIFCCFFFALLIKKKATNCDNSKKILTINYISKHEKRNMAISIYGKFKQLLKNIFMRDSDIPVYKKQETLVNTEKDENHNINTEDASKSTEIFLAKLSFWIRILTITTIVLSLCMTINTIQCIMFENEMTFSFAYQVFLLIMLPVFVSLMAYAIIDKRFGLILAICYLIFAVNCWILLCYYSNSIAILQMAKNKIFY